MTYQVPRRIRIRAWWLRATGRRWDHDLLRRAERLRRNETREANR